MPAVYVRMLSYAWGEPVAARTWLLGEIFSPDQAHALGMVRELVPAQDLLDAPARPRPCATSPASPTRSTPNFPAG
jgi:enoyl-CoA hydratase/carnithine racemase